MVWATVQLGMSLPSRLRIETVRPKSHDFGYKKLERRPSGRGSTGTASGSGSNSHALPSPLALDPDAAHLWPWPDRIAALRHTPSLPAILLGELRKQAACPTGTSVPG